MSAGVLARPEVTLDDRYVSEHGTVLLSGIQALVRVAIDQRRLDQRAGRNTGLFVSGYQGSPLGGLDRELLRGRRHLYPLGIVFQPGLNEELAATAVAGTQLLGSLKRRRHDGVTGIWFGKAPGLDRATDPIRHGNISGTMPLGGAVAWIGDDPMAKSSTVPSASEALCRSLMMPLLAPGDVRELRAFGLHAIALSRHSGAWSGLKIVADIADASMSVDLDGIVPALPVLETRVAAPSPMLLGTQTLEAEEDLMEARLARVHEYVGLAGLNRIAFEPARPRLAIVAAGLSHQAVLRAVEDLGLDLDALGIRLVALGVPWPLERDAVRRLVAGVETVLVVEDKLPFVEAQVKEALYRVDAAPLVLGKEDADGRPLLPSRSAVLADEVARTLGRLLRDEALGERARRRLETLSHPLRVADASLPARTPYFCSGCPHNTSTRAQPDQLVGAGIGCHTMVVLEGDDRRGDLVGLTQMGGEGAQWLGLAPFTGDDHFIQNLGDGTFHHSGSLAIRAAVAGGVNITYRLLYNDAVAMTGGQQPQGRMAIPQLTRWLALEGVRWVVVTTPEPERYRDITLDPIAQVRHRDELQDAQRELAGVPGVTVLIHDDQCATEKRRLRKRGSLPTPAERVVINQRVCEGCGDCGEQSTCLSVVPVQTEFGRKTRIDQASCNSDMSCLKGDCPSFLLVTPSEGVRRRRTPPEPPVALTEPHRLVGDDVLVRMPGVGGTGVVTVSAILQMAAHLDGRHAAGLEQIGLAQKGGPVISDIRIATAPVAGQLRATTGAADVILGFDVLGAAAPQTLAVADPARTVAVISTTTTPTARQAIDPAAPVTDVDRARRRIDAVTRAKHNRYLDAAALSEHLFADHLPANLLLVGAAFQHGCLPLAADAIEAAIRLDGTGVEANLAAFRWGRALVIDPAAIDTAVAPHAAPAAPDPRAVALVGEATQDSRLQALLEGRAGELIAYQGVPYARRYVEDVVRVARRAGDGAWPAVKAYAFGLHKLMAYKDEYEVARLHLLDAERARLSEEFGPDAKVRILLHPPLLRAMGLKHKLRLGPWVFPFLRALRHGRRLRGTTLDPFGRAELRRVERALIGEYRELVENAVARLDATNAAVVAEIAGLADIVRGYEDVKLHSVERFRTRAAALLDELDRPAPSLDVTAVHPVTV